MSTLSRLSTALFQLFATLPFLWRDIGIESDNGGNGFPSRGVRELGFVTGNYNII